eukprot:COSAG02_NODE_553_length_20425_cov_17.986372_6_plen_53_part_00
MTVPVALATRTIAAMDAVGSGGRWWNVTVHFQPYYTVLPASDLPDNHSETLR